VNTAQPADNATFNAAEHPTSELAAEPTATWQHGQQQQAPAVMQSTVSGGLTQQPMPPPELSSKLGPTRSLTRSLTPSLTPPQQPVPPPEPHAELLLPTVLDERHHAFPEEVFGSVSPEAKHMIDAMLTVGHHGSHTIHTLPLLTMHSSH
jgi:hypothetical protein